MRNDTETSGWMLCAIGSPLLFVGLFTQTSGMFGAGLGLCIVGGLLINRASL